MKKSSRLLNILTIIIASIGGCAAALSLFIVFYSVFLGKSFIANSHSSPQDITITQNDIQPEESTTQSPYQEDNPSFEIVTISDRSDTDNSSTGQSSTNQAEDSIPLDYSSALDRAIAYSNMNMSKADIYVQLVSNYGDKFSSEAAQYAIDHVVTDQDLVIPEIASYHQEAEIAPSEELPDTPDSVLTASSNEQETAESEVQTDTIPTELPLETNTTEIVPTPETDVSTPIGETVWLSATGEKYHRINNCGRMNPNKARQVSLEYALNMGYEKCKNCY